MPLNQLRRLHPFLAKLSLEAVGTILQCGSIIVLERDQVLYKEKEEDLKFYMIIFGCLELLTTQRKQRTVIKPDESPPRDHIQSVTSLQQLEPIDEARSSARRGEEARSSVIASAEKTLGEAEPANTGRDEGLYGSKNVLVLTTQSDE